MRVVLLLTQQVESIVLQTKRYARLLVSERSQVVVREIHSILRLARLRLVPWRRMFAAQNALTETKR
jgi:hypothetical protein